MITEHLPFRVIRVKNQKDLNIVCRLRCETYGRHLPEFAQLLAEPEPADFESDNLVFLAIEKGSEIPLATMRIQTNLKKPLLLQQLINLPEYINSSIIAEAVRFGVVKRQGSVGYLANQARDALFKSFYLTCIGRNIEWMVITARHPLKRLYSSLLFEDISPNGEPINLPYVNNIPHHILKICVSDVEFLWRKSNHHLYDYFFKYFHPDLEIF